MKSQIRFYEGIRGSGVVVSITYGDSRVIFDFGAPFNPATQPYDGVVERRRDAWVRDAIRLGQIPAIDGVFSAKDLGPHSSIQPYEDSSLTTGVIISHLHLDHMSSMGMVAPQIPVYLQREAYNLQLRLNKVGESVGPRDYTPVDYYEPFYIGEIKVTAYFSDHPCAGASGYLIEPPDGKYYYSGDVRMHGLRLPRVLEDMEKIAAEQVDVMILETTTFSPAYFEKSGSQSLQPSLDVPEGMQTEQEMMDNVLADLKPSDKLGLFNIYHRDMQLIESLYRIAEATGRELVFEPETAYVVMGMLGKTPPVYLPDNPAYLDHEQEYLKDVLSQTPRVVSLEEINAAPHKFFLQNSYKNILELFDLPAHGAKYYHLYGEPLVKGTLSYDNMLRVLDKVGVDYAAFANLYCFNHAYPNSLVYMADKISAKTLIGVHSLHPEKLVVPQSKQVLPQNGQTYELSDGQLTLVS